MEEQYLQAGFEIKLACDALSRRILRWHWEKTPRPNTLKELLRYVEQRSVEAPDYYANSAVLQDKANITWQQLDTTFCMRVMLDGETNAAKPKHLLDHALQAGAARHACNGLRIARNAAAHATDKAGVAKAIATFDETLDDLERAYGLTLLSAGELAEYDALVTRATEACKPPRKAAPKTPAKPKAAASAPAAKKAAPQPKAKAAAKASAGGSAKRNTAPRKTPRSAGKKPTQSKTGFGREQGFVFLAIVVFVAAFLLQFARA